MTATIKPATAAARPARLNSCRELLPRSATVQHHGMTFEHQAVLAAALASAGDLDAGADEVGAALELEALSSAGALRLVVAELRTIHARVTIGRRRAPRRRARKTCQC